MIRPPQIFPTVMSSIQVSRSTVRRLGLPEMEKVLPRRSESALAENKARLGDLARDDGLPDWTLHQIAVEDQLTEYASIIVPYVWVGTPVAGVVAGYGDIPWAGTCSRSRGVNLSRGGVTYQMPAVPCRTGINIFRDGELAGTLAWGEHVRMGGVTGWDKFKNVIAGAPYGFVCNMVAFIAWLNDPPKIPSTTEWKIPQISAVNLSALYAYTLLLPTPVLTTRAIVVTGKPATLNLALWDANRNTIGTTTVDLTGEGEEEILCVWTGFPFLPQSGFVELTPPIAMTVKSIDTVPPCF